VVTTTIWFDSTARRGFVDLLYACTRVRVEWKSECVMDGESGEQVEDELESATYIIIFHIFHIFKTQLHCTTDRRLI